jgi:O-antigen ligase
MYAIQPDNRFINTTVFLYFMLLPFIFLGGISDPFLLARQLFTNAFLLIVLLFVLIAKKDSRRFLFDRTTGFFFGFILLGIVSFSEATIVANSHALLSKYITFFVFFITLSGLLYNDFFPLEKLKTAVIFFGIISITIALLAILNKTISGQNLFRQIDMISGTFANKNLLSSLLFCCLPFYFVGLTLSKKFKTIGITAIAMTIFILIVLRTRTTLIALAIFLLLVLIYRFKKYFSGRLLLRFFVAGLLIGTATLILGLFFLKDSFHSSPQITIQYFYRLLDTETLVTRTQFWENSVSMVRDNFFGGVGLGNWIVEFPGYGLNHISNPEITKGRMLVGNPHNDFLQVFCETGIIGFLCYAGIFISILFQTFWLMKNAKTPAKKNMFFYFFSFILGYIFIAFFDFPLDRMEHQIVLMTVFAIVNASYWKAKRKEGLKSSKAFFWIVALVFVLYSSIVALNRITGEKQHAENYFYTVDTKGFPMDWHEGTALFRQKKYEKSVSYFENAYHQNPYNINIINDLASNLILIGRYDEGITMYKKALALSKDFEDARINLAAVYFNNAEYENAFQTIDKCPMNIKHKNYKAFLIPIVEKKLNLVLAHLNNTKRNAYFQHRIATAGQLLELYFESKNNNDTFEHYITSIKY